MRFDAPITALRARIGRTTAGYMVVLAVLVGLLGGYGAVVFRYAIDLFQSVWPLDGFETGAVTSLPWYWIVGLPTAGGIVVGAITRWFAPEAKGHGVPEVIEAVALRSGVIRPRVVGAKALASGVCIASGGSVGREGPIAQIGAAIGSSVGQLMRVQPRRLRTLVACGAAAGIAATFNAPVAGALFAVEVILGDFAVHQFSPIVISSVVATVVSRHHLDNAPTFAIPQAQIEAYRLVHPLELVAYAALGIAAGLLAFAFIRSLCFAEDRFDGADKLPLPVRAAIGGAIVGCIALMFPDVLGVGYEAMHMALLESPSATLLASLLVAKLVATCLTLGSGGSGGVFAPSLFLGAMLGGLVGLAVNAIAPSSSAPANAYALVGMGSVVAATTRAPITTILIVFELTSDYRIMLPLMTSCIIATQFAQRLSKESIYTVKLARRGTRIRAGQDVNLLQNIPVREVLREGAPTVERSVRLSSLLERLVADDTLCIYVVKPDGRLDGVISMRELRPVLKDTETLGDLVVAIDVAALDIPRVHIDENLDTVLARLDFGYRDELPVLDGDRLAGVVRVEDVLSRYRRELAKRELASEPGD